MLPVGAVPARLLRSGEYTIRLNIYLIRGVALGESSADAWWRLAATGGVGPRGFEANAGNIGLDALFDDP